MKCNKCGNIVNDNVKFCTKCGNDLRVQNNTICSKCGSIVSENEIFCPECGHKLGEPFYQEKNNTSELNDLEDTQSYLEKLISSREFYPICFGVLIFIVLIALICGFSTINFPEWIKEQTTPKALNCEAPDVKDLVVRIASKNDYFYNDIDSNTISKTYIRYPAITGYEKDIDKYHCTGQFVVESVSGGFKPSLMDYKNHYYNKFHSYYNDYEDKLTKNTQYVCNVKYSSQISEGQILVESNYCSSGGAWLDSGLQGSFSCEVDNCDPIMIHKKDRPSIDEMTYNSSNNSNDYSSSSGFNSSYSYNNSYTPQPTPNTSAPPKIQNSLKELENQQNYDQQKQNVVEKDIEDAENELF